MTPRIEMHPTRDDARTVFCDFQTRAVGGSNKPIVEYVGSDDSEDRYGSVIDPRGWETDAYMRSGSGVVLWAHDYRVPPIGRTIRLEKTKRELRFVVEFAVNQSRFASEIYSLVRDGFLPGVSVGFIPKDGTSYTSQTVGKTHAENVRYTKQELLELSVVPVPANRNALKRAYADGRISDLTMGLAGLRAFIDGAPSVRRTPLPSRNRYPRPAGMSTDLYEAALRAGLRPDTALRIEEILRRRGRR